MSHARDQHIRQVDELLAELEQIGATGEETVEGEAPEAGPPPVASSARAARQARAAKPPNGKPAAPRPVLAKPSPAAAPEATKVGGAPRLDELLGAAIKQLGDMEQLHLLLAQRSSSLQAAFVELREAMRGGAAPRVTEGAPATSAARANGAAKPRTMEDVPLAPRRSGEDEEPPEVMREPPMAPMPTLNQLAGDGDEVAEEAAASGGAGAVPDSDIPDVDFDVDGDE